MEITAFCYATTDSYHLKGDGIRQVTFTRDTSSLEHLAKELYRRTKRSFSRGATLWIHNGNDKRGKMFHTLKDDELTNIAHYLRDYLANAKTSIETQLNLPYAIRIKSAVKEETEPFVEKSSKSETGNGEYPYNL